MEVCCALESPISVFVKPVTTHLCWREAQTSPFQNLAGTVSTLGCWVRWLKLLPNKGPAGSDYTNWWGCEDTSNKVWLWFTDEVNISSSPGSEGRAAYWPWVFTVHTQIAKLLEATSLWDKHYTHDSMLVSNFILSSIQRGMIWGPMLMCQHTCLETPRQSLGRNPPAHWCRCRCKHFYI